MRASDIRLTDCNSYGECQSAITEIESDHHNILGGMGAWMSGYSTQLNKGAQAKVLALSLRAERLLPDE